MELPPQKAPAGPHFKAAEREGPALCRRGNEGQDRRGRIARFLLLVLLLFWSFSQ